jgi:hypothetical protein
MILELSRKDLVSMAMAVSDAARSAYNDERLHVAADWNKQASRLWSAARYERLAQDHSILSNSIQAEARDKPPCL